MFPLSDTSLTVPAPQFPERLMSEDVSLTPNAPNGLFEKIEKEPESSCIYNRIKLDYTYGLGKIYTKEEIDKARRSPSFAREYDIQYLGLIGNTFHTKDIDRAVELGIMTLIV